MWAPKDSSRREGPGTAQADIYSLGKVIYEISTGKDRQNFPEPLTELVTAADHKELLELNEVTLKACEDNVRRRYQSADEMHADLLLLQGGRSVKRLHMAERRLALATRAGLLLAVLALAILAVLYEVNRERRAATRSVVRLHVASGTRSMNEGDLFGSLLSFSEALRLDAGSAKREEPHRIRIGSVLKQCPKLIGVFEHEQRVNGAVFSPGQSRVATASDDHTASVWDLPSGRNCFTLRHPGPVYSVAWSPDGQLIVTTSVDHRLHLWDAHTGEPVVRATMQHLGKWTKPEPRFSSDSARLLTLIEPNAAQLWDVATGRAVGQPLVHENSIDSLEPSPDGRWVTTLDNAGQFRVWKASTGELLWVCPPGTAANWMAFRPDSLALATAGDDGFVRFWSVTSGAPLGVSLDLRVAAEAVALARKAIAS